MKDKVETRPCNSCEGSGDEDGVDNGCPYCNGSGRVENINWNIVGRVENINWNIVGDNKIKIKFVVPIGK